MNCHSVTVNVFGRKGSNLRVTLEVTPKLIIASCNLPSTKAQRFVDVYDLVNACCPDTSSYRASERVFEVIHWAKESMGRLERRSRGEISDMPLEKADRKLYQADIQIRLQWALLHPESPWGECVDFLSFRREWLTKHGKEKPISE